jgi:hypothetical protein
MGRVRPPAPPAPPPCVTRPDERLPQWGKEPGAPEEIRFLEGPQTRGFELRRALRIFVEFLRGFRTLHFVGPCVTVFGSARFPPDHPYYRLAREVGAHLARSGFTVMTGGGPGIMEAANRGAREAGGRSVGCNIELPHEQVPNPYLDRWITFRYFFVRKVMLVKYSYAFIALPGGFGTADELFEILTWAQLGLHAKPIGLLNVAGYFDPLLAWLDQAVREEFLRPPHRRLLLEADDPDRLIDLLQCYQPAAATPKWIDAAER